MVFDLDGTLVDSRADLAASANAVRRSVGLPPLDPATIAAYVGDGARALVERALGEAHRAHWDDGLARFLAVYGDRLLDATRPYAGIPEMLTRLFEAGIALSVLTNKPQAASRRIVDGLGLQRWIGAVLGGDVLASRKPDPAGLRLLMARERSHPTETLLVGDSVVDEATAAAAGTGFCGVAWGFGPTGWTHGRPVVIAAPGDLPALVERGLAAGGAARVRGG